MTTDVKLSVLVYNILQPLPYWVRPQGPENRQLTSSFFVGAQTSAGLLQTTQIKQGVSFIAANKVYISTNKTTIVSIETESFVPGVDASRIYVRASALGCFYSHISTRTFRRGLTASVDSCMEIKSAPSVASPNLAEFGGRCQKAVLGVCTDVTVVTLLQLRPNRNLGCFIHFTQIVGASDEENPS